MSFHVQADPHAKNFLRRIKHLSESEDDEEETEIECDKKKDKLNVENDEPEAENDNYTPLDYASNDEEIVAILRGTDAECASKKDDIDGGMDSGYGFSVSDIHSVEDCSQ